MKYATLLLGLAIVIASVAVATAKVDRKCVREMREVYGGTEAWDGHEYYQWPGDGGRTTHKRQCDPDNFVTDPNQYGWHRLPENACELERVKGKGAKQRRDAACGGD